MRRIPGEKEKQETSKIIDGITACCEYDFDMDGFYAKGAENEA